MTNESLVERLRDCAKVTFSAGLHGVEHDCKEAADVIERQAKKVETLRGILDRIVSHTLDGELAMLITGNAAVEAAREYVALKRSAVEPPAPVRSCSCPCHSDDELCEECCDGTQRR